MLSRGASKRKSKQYFPKNPRPKKCAFLKPRQCWAPQRYWIFLLCSHTLAQCTFMSTKALFTRTFAPTSISALTLCVKETQMQRMDSDPFSAFAFASLVAQCKKWGQECIPVGCVPPTLHRIGGLCLAGDLCPGILFQGDPTPHCDRQTPVKLLPFPKLRLRDIKMQMQTLTLSVNRNPRCIYLRLFRALRIRNHNVMPALLTSLYFIASPYLCFSTVKRC